MSLTISLSEKQTLSVLRSFLLYILPAGIEVIRGQVNRVSEPDVSDFVVMTPIMRERLSTNQIEYNDASLTGEINGNVMTITTVAFGHVVIGAPVFGANIPSGVYVMEYGTGTGGVGTYIISQSLTVASGSIYAGTAMALQATRTTVQLDVHGPDAADNVQRITTMFRAEFATSFFGLEQPGVIPLYTSEPHQMPFSNGEQQIETRWTVDAVMQVNPVITAPQQFADAVEVAIIPAD